MIREHGNMWDIYDTTDYFLVTTNSYIRADGELVMGRGMAKQTKDRHPQVPITLGREIRHLNLYGLILIGTGPTIGAFQVKRHFKYDAETDIIKFSTGKLKRISEANPDMRFDLNFPGIGNGKLTMPEVLGILEVLPDNVYIWTYT